MTVHLIGAGCAGPGWVTCEALRIIKTSEHIVYDRLIHPDLLQLAPINCIFHYAGKRKDNHRMSQEEINQLLVELGEKSHSVTRLKGGDPFVFGRGGEEALALEKAHIPWDYTPGITSAIGGIGAAGIPLTHRGLADCATLITGHNKIDSHARKIFKDLSDLKGTKTIYMGASSSDRICKDLIESGEDPHTPCASVTWGGWGRAGKDCFELKDMAQKDIKSPSIITVGEVTSLKLTPQKGFLSGLQIAIVRPSPVSWHTARYLETFGADCYSLPMLQMEVIKENWDIEVIRSSDWLVITSPRSAQLLKEAIDLRYIGARILSIGSGTTKALKQIGLKPDYEASTPTSEGVASSLKELVHPSDRVCFFRNELASDLPVKAVKDTGATPIVLSSYRMIRKELPGEELYRSCWDETGLDYIVFGSAALVSAWNDVFGDLPCGTKAITWGIHCAEKAMELFQEKPLIMNTPDMEGLVEKLKEEKGIL